MIEQRLDLRAEAREPFVELREGRALLLQRLDLSERAAPQRHQLLHGLAMLLDPSLARQGLLDPPFGHLHAALQRDDARLKRLDLLTNALDVLHSRRQTLDLVREGGSAAPGLVQARR